MIGAIIQARMGARRLPGKVLLPLGGKAVLEHVVTRAQMAKRIEGIIVATSTDPEDDVIEDFCGKISVNCFRGPLNDVLGRFYQAARIHRFETIVRLTADCPLLDPKLIDELIEFFLLHPSDYLANVNPPTYPDGLDTEIFTFEALAIAHRLAKRATDREHVTTYIRNHPQLFSTCNFSSPVDYSSHRWTLDERSDYEFLQEVCDKVPNCFDFKVMVRELEKFPALSQEGRGITRNEGLFHSEAGDRRIRTGQKLYERAKGLIPGGTQLLSKRPEMFLPEQWPAYYSRAQGCEVWDMDDNHFYDFSISGVGSCLLGFADPDVNNAVHEAVERGTMATLNCPEEVALAEMLCELHPWAEMVRFTRSGGESMAVAIRLARARTGRDVVAFCGYHGWSDWYLAANLSEDRALDGHLLPGLRPLGVPRPLTGTAVPFRFNHPEEIVEIVAKHGKNLAAIVMEPLRSEPPTPGFLQAVRSACQDTGALLVVDEITMGFRLGMGGAHLIYGMEPDLAVFAKGMSNGFAMGAVVGRGEVMQAAQETFISSTYWTERIGPSAALATIGKLRQNNVTSYLSHAGRKIKGGWKLIAEQVGISILINGVDPLPSFSFALPNPIAAKTLFTQEMWKRGYLAGTSVYVTWAHKEGLIDTYLQVVHEVISAIRTALESGQAESHINGPVAHSGFKRLT